METMVEIDVNSVSCHFISDCDFFGFCNTCGIFRYSCTYFCSSRYVLLTASSLLWGTFIFFSSDYSNVCKDGQGSNKSKNSFSKFTLRNWIIKSISACSIENRLCKEIKFTHMCSRKEPSLNLEDDFLNSLNRPEPFGIISV